MHATVLKVCFRDSTFISHYAPLNQYYACTPSRVVHVFSSCAHSFCAIQSVNLSYLFRCLRFYMGNLPSGNKLYYTVTCTILYTLKNFMQRKMAKTEFTYSSNQTFHNILLNDLPNFLKT